MEKDFFNIKYNKIPPAKGMILVAEPFTADPFFGRSVVLITSHNDEGSAGIVLNKQLDISLSDTFSDISKNDDRLFLGGPVSNDRLFYLHTFGEAVPNSIHIYENVYWGGDFDVILDFLKTAVIEKGTIRFFAGYSGWSSKQLSSELQKDFWLVTSLDSKSVMNSTDNIWEECVKKAGKEYQSWLNLPIDPNLN